MMANKRILLVEDDPSVGTLIKEHLSTLGPEFQVEWVLSGEQAVEQVEAGPYDLVVTDNRMSGISGLELIDALRSKTPATLAILITGYGSEDTERRARRLNVYHYLTKPFALGELKRLIRDALSPAAPAPAPAVTAPSQPSARQTVKVTLAGDAAVGKTSLISRLRTNHFEARRTMTIGVDFHIYDVKHQSSHSRLIVWDVGGQDQFGFTRRAFYRGSKAVGLVYDASNRASFERLQRWNAEIRESLPIAPLVLAGNKIDLPRQVEHTEGLELADQWHVPFFETSCVSGEGIREFFDAVAAAASIPNPS